MTKYLVKFISTPLCHGSHIDVYPGHLVKDLTDDQLKRRKNHLKKVKKGVWECISHFQFKNGEVVTLDSNVAQKRNLRVLFEPDKLELPEDNEEESIFDDMTKRQLIEWASENRKGLELDMKMTRDDMLDEIKTFPGKKSESNPEKTELKDSEKEDDDKKGKAPN